MANNYCQWSASLALCNTKEGAWARARLQELDVDWEGLEEEAKVTLLKLGYDENATGLEIQWEVKDMPDLVEKYVWLSSEESGNIENTVAFVQEFLRHFERDDIFHLTWADTCDKMRIDQFSGGAVVVTAKETRYLNAFAWVEDQERRIREGW